MIDLLGNDQAVRFLETSLDMLSVRHSLIASNIANVDTPNYKAVDLDFSRELRVAFERRESQEIGIRGARLRYEEVLSPRIVESGGPARFDGNNVNIDSEMGKLAQTSGWYAQATKMMAVKLRMIKAAIRD
ncbi:MAG TPA: flagellar basal body rod protein FlgB [Acidobacteriota bacterium]|nr:flagellar basal body rod protein FlgB [Acidobacteriota bacterium]